jgi:bifunctional enzyme CysN/CysC
MPRARKNPASAQIPEVTQVDEWLMQQARLDLLRFITCGSVDDGKSTLIGRLLWELQQVFDDQLSGLQADSRRHGTQGNEIDFALLVDGLAAEREQNITIDVAYRYFSTPRRKFIVADTPGHEQYTRNMITGASMADAAVVLVDARRGVLAQTCRHAHLVSLVGIGHVVLAINKMDLMGYRRKVFDAIVSDFTQMANTLGLQGMTAIPLSALKGDNVTARSGNTPWYQGPTLVGCLENLEARRNAGGKTAFPVQWVNRTNADFRGLSGTVASGRLAVGDELRVTASGQSAKLSRLVTADGDLQVAQAGDAVTLVLDRELDASRGDVLSLAQEPLDMTDQLQATLVWLHQDEGIAGRNYDLKLSSQWACASITGIKYRVDVNTQAHEACKKLQLNDIAVCNIALSKPVVFDTYKHHPGLGSFILVDRFTYATVAAGMIRHSLRRAQNVHSQALLITQADRERLNSHKGKVIWFTGLSGSGKSTLANALEVALHSLGIRTYVLDGDNIRQGLNKDLGFTPEDRVENIRRIAEVSRLMMDAGLIVMTALISPFRREREMARDLIGAENFIEVFVNTPLEVCEERDVKGLYKQARAGKIPNMTGINSAYEPPLDPTFEANAAKDSVDSIVSRLSALALKPDS